MIPAARRERDLATGPRAAGQGQGPPRPQAGVDAEFDAQGLAGGAGEVEPRFAAASSSEARERTEVLARGSSASPGRTTAWVAVHARSPEQRVTAPGTEAHAAALVVLRKAQPVYDALLAVADPAAPADAPDTFCRRLRARLQTMLGAADADAWQSFVVWARGARGGLAPGLPPRQDGGGHEPTGPVRAAALPGRPREDRPLCGAPRR